MTRINGVTSFALVAMFGTGTAAAGQDVGSQNAAMIQETMGLLKESLDMLAHLDRAPTTADRKRLEAMMQQLDAMMSKQRQLISVMSTLSK